jgi:ABC-type glycerol-3-phosphate transport system permease component
LVSTGILAFITAWKEFLLPLIFTVTDQMKTVLLVISQLSGATL